MSLFERLKKTSGSQSDAMQKRLEQQGQRSSVAKDPRLWKWSWNKEGVSENVIRFLPVPLVDMKAQEEGTISEESVLTPVALVMKHAFQGPGGWYMENSPQTFGNDDPVRDHDRPLWAQQKATNDTKLKDVLKERLPSTKYYANILVIKDGNNPENNGKVFLLEFGPAIKKFLDAAQNPKFSTDPKFDPFDLWEGANLKLNLVGEQRKFGNWEGLVPQFDKVSWDNPSSLGDDAFKEEIWAKEHSLFEFFNPANYKPYDKLEERLRKVLAIPDGQPLVESGAATMAKAPDAPSTPSTPPRQTAQESLQHQQSQPSQTSQTTTAPAGNGPDPKQTASIDEFEQYLKGQ